RSWRCRRSERALRCLYRAMKPVLQGAHPDSPLCGKVRRLAATEEFSLARPYLPALQECRQRPPLLICRSVYIHRSPSIDHYPSITIDLRIDNSRLFATSCLHKPIRLSIGIYPSITIHRYISIDHYRKMNVRPAFFAPLIILLAAKG